MSIRINNKDILVETPNGLEPFKGIQKVKKSCFWHLITENKHQLKCSLNHRVKTSTGFKKACDILVDEFVEVKGGTERIVYSEFVNEPIELFDFLDVGKDSVIYTNNIISHNCEFIGSASTLISPTKLSTMSYVNPKFKKDEVEFHEDVKPGHRYLITADCARGLRLDYSAFVVVDVTTLPYKVVAKYRSNLVTPLIFPQFLHNIGKYFNNAWLLVETNDVGGQVAESLAFEFQYENLLKTVSRGRAGFVLGSGQGAKNGVTTTSAVKTKGCSNFKSLVETNRLIIEDYDIYVEMTTFTRKGDSADAQFGAEPGTNDDLVMCMVLFSWCVASEYWKELTDTSPSNSIYNQKVNEQEDLMPLGFVSYAKMNDSFVESGDVWEVIDFDEDPWTSNSW